MNDDTLYIAEILHENGGVKCRYSRIMSEDGTRWIRHGLFQAFHENGTLASEGIFENRLESGLWKDFHENGQLAAQGDYKEGKEFGEWQYWSSEGHLDRS